MTPGMWKLADLVITLALAGIDRLAIVDKVKTMEEAGATPDEITDALQNMRQASEVKAQDDINKAT